MVVMAVLAVVAVAMVVMMAAVVVAVVMKMVLAVAVAMMADGVGGGEDRSVRCGDIWEEGGGGNKLSPSTSTFSHATARPNDFAPPK